MILFGANYKKIAVEPIENCCTYCQTSGTMDVHIFQRYAHVFMLPLFPAGRYSVSQCNHCRKVLRERAMTPELRHTCNEAKAGTQTPLWTFAGAILVFIVTVLIKNYS